MLNNKYLLTGIFSGILLISTSSIQANECIIREDILPVNKYDFHINNTNMTKQQPVQTPCEVNSNSCPVNGGNITTEQHEKFAPCEELQRTPNEIMKETIDNDDINAVLTYYDKADTKLNLTEEQQVKLDEIKQNAIKKMVETNQIISSKKAEILSLQSAEDKNAVEKKIKSAEKYVSKLQKDMDKIKKQLDKDYYSVLSVEQKAIYKEYKQAATK